MAESVRSPAKINLALAVTGPRGDGFHDLVSVVAPLDWGDELALRPISPDAPAGPRLACDDPAVPVDASNLVLRAAAAFAAATGRDEAADFQLTKRIPMGAGLGGGSSNAVAALRLLNARAGRPLEESRLAELAAGLGSDCVLFLHEAPVVMRGRGERVEQLPEAAVRRLRGRRVLLFKPSFGVGTGWAYAQLAQRRTDYVAPEAAERGVRGWIESDAPAEALLGNNFEPGVFGKFPALSLLLRRIRGEAGVAAGMSGSGSTCFALLPADETAAGASVTRLQQIVREAWGDAAFVQPARLA